jgi:hypothetical protein
LGTLGALRLRDGYQVRVGTLQRAEKEASAAVIVSAVLVLQRAHMFWGFWLGVWLERGMGIRRGIRRGIETSEYEPEISRVGRGRQDWQGGGKSRRWEVCSEEEAGGLRAVCCWIVGRWTVDGGRWTVDGGRWTVDGGR